MTPDVEGGMPTNGPTIVGIPGLSDTYVPQPGGGPVEVDYFEAERLEVRRVLAAAAVACVLGAVATAAVLAVVLAWVLA